MKIDSLSTAFELTGQTALITGGGTGLGLGMARCLARAGAQVILVGRRAEELQKAVAEIGPRAQALVGDVTALDTLPGLVDAAEKLAGPITILANNAGIHLKKPALETADADFARVLETHVFGAFALSREVARRMLPRQSGCILFTASMASLMGIPLVVAYSAAKSAYVGMVRTLAVEWGPQGIRVNAIAPGWIGSPMLEQALAGDPPRKAKIMGRIPQGKFGEPDDIGWAAVYLASPAAKYVN
ncbi:MAG TPA: SDR family oxidoreductase, partial [Verrucomicrobiae bacterium]